MQRRSLGIRATLNRFLMSDEPGIGVARYRHKLIVATEMSEASDHFGSSWRMEPAADFYENSVKTAAGLRVAGEQQS